MIGGRFPAFEQAIQAEAVWLPNHRMELSTRADYTSAINRHIMWFFGPMKMRDIGPGQVREWITALKARGVSPRRTEYSKNSVLNPIFTTALDDGVIVVHPSHRVATDPVPRKPRRILTATQFDAVYAALPNSDAQLLVETAIETGLRWGELTELRAGDIDVATGLLTVSRAVIAVSRKHHPASGRFWVKNYPKDREYRQLRMSDRIVRKLSAHMTAHDLGAGDLLFARRGNRGPRTRPAVLADPQTLGWTEPNHAGRRYRHGTTTAYGLGRYRCEHCRRAVALYRTEGRRNGNDRPAKAPAVGEGDPHINASTFRASVLQPAFRAAGVEGGTMHGLRHAHASWLLAGGADLPGREEATRAREDLDHAGVPAHPPRRRPDGAGRTRQDPQEHPARGPRRTPSRQERDRGAQVRTGQSEPQASPVSLTRTGIPGSLARSGRQRATDQPKRWSG
jgi:integrase